MTDKTKNPAPTPEDQATHANKGEGLISRFQTLWATLAIVGAIFLAGWKGEAYITSEIKDQLTSQLSPVKDQLKDIHYSLDGNPATGAKGINERLASIETKITK